MHKLLLVPLATAMFVFTSQTSSGKDLEVQRAEDVAAIAYEDVNFEYSHQRFLKEFRGAMKLDHADGSMGVTHYGILVNNKQTDLVGLIFRGDHLMSLLFTYQKDRIELLGGYDNLWEGAVKRFGSPTRKEQNAFVWNFPAIDRTVKAIAHDQMWTLAIERTSIHNQLQAEKQNSAAEPGQAPEAAAATKPVVRASEEQSSQTVETKEGWVFWKPTPEEQAEMEAEARVQLHRSGSSNVRDNRRSSRTRSRSFTGQRASSSYSSRHPSTGIASEMRRYIELGKKKYPTRAEIREYLLLDARLSVRSGKMTIRQFEEFTGEEY